MKKKKRKKKIKTFGSVFALLNNNLDFMYTQCAMMPDNAS